TLSDVNRIGEAVFRKIAEEAPPEQREETLKMAKKKIIMQLIENKLLNQQAACAACFYVYLHNTLKLFSKKQVKSVRFQRP
ncbi:MAG: hypothetical protein D3906_12175, partial [Candidatus Electrothrix sp. AUS1_2]|nr:hypothetical protein [Candidatus Electrothrix sp. AUS1_2]